MKCNMEYGNKTELSKMDEDFAEFFDIDYLLRKSHKYETMRKRYITY